MRWSSLVIAVALSVLGCGSGGDDDSSAGMGGTSGSGGGSSGNGGSGADGGSGGSTTTGELLDPIDDVSVNEDESVVITLVTSSGVKRVWAEGLPPGAHLHEAEREIRFRPDFIQGRDEPWNASVTVSDGTKTLTQSFTLTVVDSIQPPPPEITNTEQLDGCKRYTLTQTTDDYLDSSGYAGRTFAAKVTVPDSASDNALAPVRILLHGYGATGPSTPGCSSDIVINPFDPMNSYWWGYSENLPDGKATTGKVPAYTVRRVLNLLAWALERHGDPNRALITGGSMGGAGAMTIGLLWGRHFAAIDATYGQAIPRNHRPGRLATLEPIWGTTELNLDDGTGMGIWDRMDLTRALAEDPEAWSPFVFTKHGKDDATIHFGAMVIASPLTKKNFYEALVGHPHYSVWDEGGHGTLDPVMPSGWWDGGWNRLHDDTAFVRSDLAVPAFSASSLNGDPGDGGGNGNIEWDENGGFAGIVSVAGDTGWSGDIAGVLNRHLRWDATKIVDTRERFEIPLRVGSGNGGDPPEASYPTLGDQLDGSLPATVDVTIRNVQKFTLAPGQSVSWELGAQSGTTTAREDGSVVVSVSLDDELATLILTL
jgi:hypothetical protein